MCSRKKIEDWIRSQKGNEVPADNVVLFSFNNCDFYQHVTNVRLDHCSTMIHACTQLVADLAQPFEVAIADIWHLIGKGQLVDFLHTVTTILPIQLQTLHTMLLV